MEYKPGDIVSISKFYPIKEKGTIEGYHESSSYELIGNVWGLKYALEYQVNCATKGFSIDPLRGNYLGYVISDLIMRKVI
jgi:hypothetical protein